MAKKAIVFGGSGFLGSHVSDVLLEAGHEVTIFDLVPSSYIQPGQKMIVGDILDREEVDEAVKEKDVVYHFAGLADLDDAKTKPFETVSKNIIGTVNILDAAVNANIEHFIFASTIYVYSSLGGFYRCSKQAGELYIEEYQRRCGLNFTILRYGSLYGPRAGNNNGIMRYLSQGLKTGKITYSGTGDEVREYIHVKDAARLTVDVFSPEYQNKHIVITGHHPMKTREMMATIREILKKDIKLEFLEVPSNVHYTLTPYSFTPKIGSKLVSNLYVDMGQGLLECLQEISQESDHS
jgi:UDP-glucose 4-epimerase